MKYITTGSFIFTAMTVATVLTANAEAASKFTESGESNMSGSASDLSITNGRYRAIDTEDGSTQALTILCIDGFCDMDLTDVVFTTCSLVTGNPYFGGVAVARGIPEHSLNDFRLKLFCLSPGQLEIDIDNDEHTTTLTGDMVPLQDGIIRRTGPGFTFFDVYTGDISPEISESNSNAGITNGYYVGADTEDGSNSSLNIVCTGNLCDIILADTGFSTCAAITGNAFYGGVAVAKDIPKDLLDDFKLNLFCLKKDEIEFDIETDEPSATLTGNMMYLQDGIIRRTATEFTYFKSSKSLENSGSDSQTSVSTGRYVGQDIDDGSTQIVSILCTSGHCDVTVQDSSFSTCIKLSGNAYLGGIGIARNIPEYSMDNFDVDLYCLKPGQGAIDIDNDTPTTTLRGDMISLEDGIIRRIGPGFTYFNVYMGDTSTGIHSSDSNSQRSKKRSKTSKSFGSASKGHISSGSYVGARFEEGASQSLDILCNDGRCDIDLASITFSICAELTGRRFYNGVGRARDIPEGLINSFDIDLYCLPQGMQVGIDIDIGTPTVTGKVDMVAAQLDGIIRTVEPEITYFKLNTD